MDFRLVSSQKSCFPLSIYVMPYQRKKDEENFYPTLYKLVLDSDHERVSDDAAEDVIVPTNLEVNSVGISLLR